MASEVLSTDGGPAFPWTEKSGDGSHFHSHGGMTMRDYFAAKAMTGLIAQSCGTALSSYPEIAAAYAYKVADAMLKARKAKNV